MNKAASALALVLLLGISAAFAAPSSFLAARATPSRAHRGDIVRIEIQTPDPAAASAAGLQALLLKPKAGAAPLGSSPVSGRPGAYRADIKLGPDAAEGLYAVHVWTGDRFKPSLIGKATFLLGKLITDYPILSLVDQKDPGTDIQAYMTDFRRIGGSFLILHVLIDAERAYYPSKIARNDVAPGSPRDLVEEFLERSDRMEYACLLSASWDMTHATDSAFIESFVKQGGIVIAFGPQIPLGNTYDRAKLFGGDQVEIKDRREITAVRKKADGFGVAVINHNAAPLEIGFRPLGEPESAGTWTELVSGRSVSAESRGGILILAVPARQFVGLEYHRLAKRR